MKALFILVVLTTTGCSSLPAPLPVRQVGQANLMTGSVLQVRDVQISDQRTTGQWAGAATGGALGGLAGHHFGRGAGKTASTILGAALGAGVGQSVGQALSQEAGQEIIVSTPRGTILVTQPGRAVQAGQVVYVTQGQGGPWVLPREVGLP